MSSNKLIDYQQNKMLQVATVIAISVSLVVVCNGDCNIYTALPTTSRSWTIGSDATLKFVGNQNCHWKLPSQSFPNDMLFIYISPFDFRGNRTCLADLSFDDRILECSVAEPQCILFMENLTMVDFQLIRERVGYESSSCKTWKVEKGRLRTITLRTFDRDSELSFKFKFQYISQSDESLTTITTKSEKIATTTYTSVRSTTTPRLDGTDEDCAACTGYIVAFAITLVLLCVSIIVVAGCAHMSMTMMCGKRHPRGRGSFYQTESIDNDVDRGILYNTVPLSTSKSPPRWASETFVVCKDFSPITKS